MTISSDTNRSGPFNCNGATTVFPFGFKVYQPTHLKVILENSAGTETVLDYGTQYTVASVGVDSGGSITTTNTYAAGNKITILLNVPFTQNIDLENQGAYFAETIERALDLQTQQSLQIKEQVARAVVLPATSTADIEKLTSAVLSLSEIQPQMQTLAPIAGDITTVAGIAGAVVAAEGNANTAAAAAVLATNKAAEAAASAAAAALFDPTNYYLKTAFKSDSTANAPVKYDANGGFSAKWLNLSNVGAAASLILGIAVDAGKDFGIDFKQGSTSIFRLTGNSGGLGLWNFVASNWAWIADATTNVVGFGKVPQVNGASVKGWDLIIEDQQASSTHAGASIAGWQTRNLNTVLVNTIGAVLAANNVTLQPGTYDLEWDAPHFAVGFTKTRLYNGTDGVVFAFGPGDYNNNTYTQQFRSFGSTRIAFSAPKAIRVEHFTGIAIGTYGLGQALGQGTEIYTRLRVRKIA